VLNPQAATGLNFQADVESVSQHSIVRNFPPGGHFCIQPPLVPIEIAGDSWERDTCGIDSRSSGLIAVVGPKSPLILRRAVQQIAHYFQREMHYDFLQYNAADNFEHTAFLWTAPGTILEKRGTDFNEIIGGCCFQPQKFKDIGRVESLQWIWIHPYKRHKGLLLKAWPYFEQRFGKFFVDPPYSAGMEKFLTEKTQHAEWVSEWRIAATSANTPEEH
jgi:hypothetical protein